MKPFAFVFPGQGSQSVGMLDGWGDHPAVRDTIDEASAALDLDIGALIHDGPKEHLDLTTNTQPVMRSVRLGTLPGISASFVSAPAREEPSFGTAPSRPCV